MALDVDASTPALVSGADPWVSASFTPPNDSLLVVKVPADWFGGTPVITVTSTGLTFEQVARQGALSQGLAEIWIARVGSNGGTPRTVTVDTSLGANTGGAKVEVWTGYRQSVPIDAVFGGANVTTNNFTANLTTGHDDCWATGVGAEWQNLGATTSTDTNEHGEPGGVACLVVRKAAATATAGAETLNFDAAGTGTPLWTWAAISIAPDTAPDPPVWYVGAGAPVAGTTSITTAAYPADWADGDKIICTVASNHTTEATEPTVAGFTKVGTINGGGGVQGAGTGNRRLTIFERDAQSGDDTTPTVSLATGNVMIAQLTAYRTGGTWEACTAVFGADTTAASSLSAAGGSNLNLDAGDMVELAYVVRDTSAHSAQAVTATGSTFSSVLERAELSSETGNDISLSVANATVLTGPSSAAPTISCTLSTSETGVVGALRIRATTATAVEGSATGVFGFTGTASGVPRTAGAATAALGFTATAAGIDRALGVATSSFGFSATAAGVDRTLGAAVATFGFAATASGVAGNPPVTGVATGAFGFTATASGVSRTLGVATASLGFMGAAAGVDRSLGQAVSTFGFTATASGRPRVFGAAAASFGFTATTAGIVEVLGVAVALFGFTGAAQGFAGNPPVTGTAAGLFGFAATAQGQPRTPGTAAGAFGFTATAQGRPKVVGVAVIAFGFTGTATGARRAPGVAQALFGFTASANGQGATVNAQSFAVVVALQESIAAVSNRYESTAAATDRHASSDTVTGRASSTSGVTN